MAVSDVPTPVPETVPGNRSENAAAAGARETMIEFSHVTKIFQQNQPAVVNLSISIDKGYITVFVG
ncbi:MAG TPA: hypothetical protein VIG41_12295, partial [Micrococcaceae bacterium]